MQILSTLEEDFPCPPSTSVEPRKYYDAFLKAEAILAAAPRKYRETADARLPELTSFIYRGGDAASALYRKRDDASEVLINLWLSSVRRTAGWYVAVNSIPAFKGLDGAMYADLPKRFKDPESLPKIGQYLAPYGIVFLWEESIPLMKLDGAVFSLPSGHIVVALSLRYSRLDHFWFTLMHELAHVVLHADQLDKPILDDFDAESDSLIEKQADRLGSDSLIPRNEWRSCPARYTKSADDIVSFAERLCIPAQCVAGRLQRELKRYDLFSEIINQYNVREIFSGN
ncbi:ImmA/IrrE family metallo-endopeptidase [Janthinobacterium sp. RT4P48]|uniref:ImmA/IrrE family metallo-endopeptidase n=1 Tax=Janthinobacterium sp. RT4P48 TaxID=3424188 RepID=UPI003F2700CC